MTAREFNEKLLEKIKTRSDITVKKYELRYGSKVYDFLKIKSKDIDAKDRIFILRAGIHGEEVSGPLTILEKIDEIVDYAHERQVKLIIYPLANPSGFETGSRYNEENQKEKLPSNDFLRYEFKRGKLVDDIKDSNVFKKWHWASEEGMKSRLTPENELSHKALKEDPLKQVVAALDLHQDFLTGDANPGAYHYGFGDFAVYDRIVEKIEKIVPVLKNAKISAGQKTPMNSDRRGFIIRHDGTFSDLFFRLGAKYSVTAETMGATPPEKAVQINLIWIFGLIDLVTDNPQKLMISARASILPKKISALSRIHLIHTSSPVGASDLKTFDTAVKELKKEFGNLKIFNVKKTELDPRYLAASEKERLRKFRQARKKVDWLAPIYGGTGCGDIVRHLTDEDLAKIRKDRPVVNGFSDSTFLINYLYFKLKMLTFHFTNACGLFSSDNHKLFFDIIKGAVNAFSFLEKDYRWLSRKPTDEIGGIAIGGNLGTFRDLLDVCDIRLKSWRPFILFVEDIEVDTEDLHRTMVALEEKGIFRNIRAIVVGRMDEKEFSRESKKFNFIFGRKEKKEEKKDENRIFNYLLAPVISAREKDNDPLYILKVNNLGHGVSKNAMIIPIGAKTVIHPGGKIEFFGPFVK